MCVCRRRTDWRVKVRLCGARREHEILPDDIVESLENSDWGKKLSSQASLRAAAEISSSELDEQSEFFTMTISHTLHAWSYDPRCWAWIFDSNTSKFPPFTSARTRQYFLNTVIMSSNVNAAVIGWRISRLCDTKLHCSRCFINFDHKLHALRSVSPVVYINIEKYKCTSSM